MSMQYNFLGDQLAPEWTNDLGEFGVLPQGCISCHGDITFNGQSTFVACEKCLTSNTAPDATWPDQPATDQQLVPTEFTPAALPFSDALDSQTHAEEVTQKGASMVFPSSMHSLSDTISSAPQDQISLDQAEVSEPYHPEAEAAATVASAPRVDGAAFKAEKAFLFPRGDLVKIGPLNDQTILVPGPEKEAVIEELFQALPAAFAPPSPKWSQDQQKKYRNQQKEALKDISKKMTDRYFQLKAKACCRVLIEMVVDIHTNGVPQARAKKIGDDKGMGCKARAKRLISVARANKRVAIDIINKTNLQDMAAGPKTYGAAKGYYVLNNENRKHPMDERVHQKRGRKPKSGQSEEQQSEEDVEDDEVVDQAAGLHLQGQKRKRESTAAQEPDQVATKAAKKSHIVQNPSGTVFGAPKASSSAAASGLQAGIASDSSGCANPAQVHGASAPTIGTLFYGQNPGMQQSGTFIPYGAASYPAPPDDVGTADPDSGIDPVLLNLDATRGETANEPSRGQGQSQQKNGTQKSNVVGSSQFDGRFGPEEGASDRSIKSVIEAPGAGLQCKPFLAYGSPDAFLPSMGGDLTENGARQGTLTFSGMQRFQVPQLDGENKASDFRALGPQQMGILPAQMAQTDKLDQLARSSLFPARDDELAEFREGVARDFGPTGFHFET